MNYLFLKRISLIYSFRILYQIEVSKKHKISRKISTESKYVETESFLWKELVRLQV